MIERVFTCAGIPVRIRSDRPEAILWAERFLSPYFTSAAEHDQATWTVTARFGQPISRTTRPPSAWSARLFLNRTGHRWTLPDGRTNILDNMGASFVIGPVGVSANYPNESVYHLGDPARLIREYVIDSLCRAGALRLHAAAVAFGKQGVLIAGGSGSGKSSTVAQFLRAGADYLSNDRTIVTYGPEMLAFPLAIRWSGAQLGWFPRGATFAASYRRLSELSRSDVVAGYPKYEVTPNELRDITECALRDRAPMRHVVITDRKDGDRRARLERISPEEGLEALRTEILAHDPAFPSFFRWEEPPPSPAGHHSVEQLLRDVDWYRLTGSYTDSSAVETLASLCTRIP